MDFNEKLARSRSKVYKWERYKGTDILPMWIADTEFRCAEPILTALHQRIAEGAFGYTLPDHDTDAITAVVAWCKRRYNWQIDPSWLVWTPGIVPAFNLFIKAVCQTGDKIIVPTPNYPPMLAAPALNDMARICIDTVLVDGRWTLDFAALEQAAADPKARVFMLCNPMNPQGSVLRQEELDSIAEICSKHGVLVCSDEIHCDLILDAVPHLPASAHPLLADTSVTLMAASKTFNLAGLGTAFAIIPNPTLRAAFNQAAQGVLPWVTITGLTATQAAFTHCDHWHQQQLAYLKQNRDFLVDEINKIAGLQVISPAATFLLWVDASQLGVADTQAWCEARGVGPSAGSGFGNKDFFRLNFGCDRAYLEKALDRLRDGPVLANK